MSDRQNGEDKGDLTAPWEPDREVVFYYNRERRLERASPAVRALNETGLMVKGGFIRSLTSTRSNTLLLISILIIMAFIMVFSFLVGGPRGAPTLGGNTLRISAGKAGDVSFIVINKGIAKKMDTPYTGEVFVAVSPVLRSSKKITPADVPVFTAQVFFTLEQEEEYRLTLPFTAENYLLLFQAGEDRITARAKNLP
ncbi:hypothetical protein AGMMS4952_20490 [Spirochaetia bacterium]|nr:hypothetical protein AGMMS4952_20490 [Spirochaetia bacterium]